jgi:oligoendopeptidase F
MTQTSKTRSRAEVPVQYQWNAESVFETTQHWDDAYQAVLALLPALEALRGHLSEGPEMLLRAFTQFEEIYAQGGKLYIYADLSHSVDQAEPNAARRMGQAQAMLGQMFAAGAFIDPEIIAIGSETAARWMQQAPGLAVYRHYIENLFRRQAHVRSAEVEEIMGMLATPFMGASHTANMLTTTDFRFEPAVTSDGTRVPFTQGSYEELLANPDREVRRSAYQNYTDAYLAYQNTLASTLTTSVNQNVFNARVRKYPSTLSGSLFENNIPDQVFHNLIDTFKKHLPVWHRYWQVRRKVLGVDTLQPYDIWAPLTTERREVPYQQAVDWICEGITPLGADYAAAVRKGCLEDRWVDVYPNQGKSSSQYSTGIKGTFPFIFVNYDDTIFSLSTLAHELGHSMHSYLTWQNQPLIYSNYSLFVAEVASNLHQALVRAYLLETQTDPQFQISVIEEAMANFHRYFFIMPTLARFELEVHQRAEQGRGLAAQDLNELMADLFSEGYGSGMAVDRQRVGITWATFSHLYADYYVYQYATGISGANALSRRILTEGPSAAADYLGFLKTGGARYPLEALQSAGVDLSTPQPVEETFAVLSGLVDRLEKLAGSGG